MDEKIVTFLRRVYREYYFNHRDIIEIPPKMASREFGYIPFGGGMIRHLSFKSAGELTAELVRQAPSSVYCSNAIYEHPTLQMDEKGWLGAELIFDIDADAIPTSCKSTHNWWFCNECKKGGMGTKPAKCPRCRAVAPEQVHWSCIECIAATKEHVRRLIDFLTDDFSISRQRIRVYFSGNRGYHASVQDERFDGADISMRSELANYIRGNGLSLKAVTQYSGSLGWARRSNMFIATMNEPLLRRNQKLTDEVVAANAALIDESVTTDIHRVFRMPGTLHGNSGMLKMRVDSLDHFDPQRQAVVLPDEVVPVHIYYSPEFYLKGNRFGPYDSVDTRIPIYAAVFLLARGLGGVAG